MDLGRMLYTKQSFLLNEKKGKKLERGREGGKEVSFSISQASNQRRRTSGGIWVQKGARTKKGRPTVDFAF